MYKHTEGQTVQRIPHPWLSTKRRVGREARRRETQAEQV